MRCWKCDTEPSDTNPFLLLRLNLTMQAYSCLPCAFETGAQESSRRITDKMTPFTAVIDKLIEGQSK